MINSLLTVLINTPIMYSNMNFKALVYAHNAAKARTATSNKAMMTNISIGKDSHLIPMMDIAPTHDNHWENTQYFDRLSEILCNKRGSYPVADLVNDMSNVIPTETEAAHEEARKVSKVVEGAATKAEYLDGIVFLNEKGNPMTEFPKSS